MWELLQRWLSRVPGCDPNLLHPFERSLLEQILSHEYHNLLAIALQSQVAQMLTFDTIRLPGFPDWLRRRCKDSYFLVQQQRGVGSQFAVPEQASDLRLQFPLRKGAQSCGNLEIRLDGWIQEIRIPRLTDCFKYPETHDYTVERLDFEDDIAIWKFAKILDNRLEPLRETIINTIVNGKMNPRSSIVAVRPGGLPELASIQLSTSYQAVMSFTSGLHLNDLWIKSPHSRNASFMTEEPEGTFLHIGQDTKTEKSYYIKIVDNAMKEEVYSNRPGTKHFLGLGIDLVQLCVNALSRKA